MINDFCGEYSLVLSFLFTSLLLQRKNTKRQKAKTSLVERILLRGGLVDVLASLCLFDAKAYARHLSLGILNGTDHELLQGQHFVDIHTSNKDLLQMKRTSAILGEFNKFVQKMN